MRGVFMNKIKIAIIGCGIITSEAHLPAIKRLKNKLEVL
jgi:predicted dehydrogenase